MSNTSELPHLLDPFDPDLEPLNVLIRRLPGRPHPSTGTRWARRGLSTVRIGKRLFTTQAELSRYLQEQSRLKPADIDDESVEPSDADLAAIEQRCDAAGI